MLVSHGGSDCLILTDLFGMCLVACPIIQFVMLFAYVSISSSFKLFQYVLVISRANES